MQTKHPKTKKWTDALWVDDYFKHYHYGVQFIGETEFYDPEVTKLETRDKPCTHTFKEFEFLKDNEEEEPWESMFDELALEEINKYRNAEFLLVELGNRGEETIVACRSKEELDLNVNTNRDYLAYDFKKGNWFIPQVVINKVII